MVMARPQQVYSHKTSDISSREESLMAKVKKRNSRFTHERGKMNIAVFGAGHVGCVSATCLASLGHRVWLVEISAFKLEQLHAGKSPVGEPGLGEHLKRYLRSGLIVLTAMAGEAVRHSELAQLGRSVNIVSNVHRDQ